MKINNINASNNLLQIAYNSVSDAININTAIPFDNTIPQSSEGQEILTVTLTPQSSTSTLVIEFVAVTQYYDNMGTNPVTCALFRDSGTDAIAAVYNNRRYDNCTYLSTFVTSGSTSSTTFKIRMGHAVGGNVAGVNQDAGNNRFFGGTANTSLTIYEYSG